MLDKNNLPLIGETVYWIDCDNDVIPHTYICNVGDVAILWGATELYESKYKNYPPSNRIALLKDISEKILSIAEQNETYCPYPVAFAKFEALYRTKQEADDVMFSRIKSE